MSILIEYQTYFDETKPKVFDHSIDQKTTLRTLKISKNSIIYRHKKTYELKEERKIKNQQSFQYEPFVVVKKEKEGFHIVNAHDSKSAKMQKQVLTMVVTDQIASQKQIALQEKRVFYIGTSLLVIEKISTSKVRSSLGKTFYQYKFFQEIQDSYRIGTDFYEDSSKASTIDDAPSCRYCFSKSIQNGNQFISVCKCEGSSKYVHVECLMHWVMQKCHYKNHGNGIYSADKKGLKCEICNELFPIEEVLPCFKQGLLKQYVIMNAIIENYQRIFIIHLQQSSSFLIGRRPQCDITLNDSSVSRNHCKLNWDSKRGNLSIEDLKSKFGTLVKRSSILIEKPAVLQRGRIKFIVNPFSQRKVIMEAIQSFFKFSKCESS